MTEANNKVLNILVGQADPLTSADIAALCDLSQIAVLKALGELQRDYSITKGCFGYKLEEHAQDRVDVSADGVVRYLPDDQKAVLQYLASDTKPRLPKAIRSALGWPESRLKNVLRWGKSTGFLTMSTQGFYYVTEKAVEQLKISTPDFMVPTGVVEKLANQVPLVPETPARKLPALPDPDTKMMLLQALAIGADGNLKRHFSELHQFVREVTRATA